MPAMFGMGGTEILVILIVALLFLGPDKLPEAAKQISKGIRDIKKQSRVLQQTIEDDEHIGGAIRDLKSALRGEEEPIRPKPIKARLPEAAAMIAPTVPGLPDASVAEPDIAAHVDAAHVPVEHNIHGSAPGDAASPEPVEPLELPRLTLPPTVGERDGDEPSATAADDAAELARLVKPAPNTVARSTVPAAATEPSAPSEPSETKHG